MRGEELLLMQHLFTRQIARMAFSTKFTSGFYHRETFGYGCLDLKKNVHMKI